jgi:hypothetical protein
VSGVALDLAPRPVRHLTARQPDAARESCFTLEDPPLALGCAMCGHPPYAHGCDAVGGHEYEVPSAELIAERLSLYVELGLHQRPVSETEFRRDHACVTLPEQVAGELDAMQAEEKPLDGGAAAVSAATPHAAVSAEQDATTPHTSRSQPPTCDDVHPVPAISPPLSDRRRPTLRRQAVGRSGSFARMRPSGATRVHPPDVSSRRRSPRGRLFPPNRHEPVGRRRHEHPAAAEGVFR